MYCNLYLLFTFWHSYMFKQLKITKFEIHVWVLKCVIMKTLHPPPFNLIVNPMKPSLDVGEKVSTRSSIYQRSCENDGRVTTIGLVFFIKQLKQIVAQGNLTYQMTTTVHYHISRFSQHLKFNFRPTGSKPWLTKIL